MHTHRPCVMLAIVFSVGIASGKFVPLPFWLWLGLGAGGLAAFLYWKKGWMIFVLVFCVGAVLMAQRHLLPASSIAFLTGHERFHLEMIEGVVDSDVLKQEWMRGQKQVFELQVQTVQIQGQKRSSSGKVRVELYADEAPRYGDLVRIRGKLHAAYDGQGKEGFSYRRYLQEQGIYWIMSVGRSGEVEVLAHGQGNAFIGQALRSRKRMIDVFYRYLEPREAGFVAALVLGDRSGMPRDLKEIFIRTGTAHILAISGMNMSIVAAVFFFIVRLLPLPRWMPFLVTVIGLFAYAFLSGWSASVVRACIMSSVILSSFAFEEESDALNSLGVAGLLLLSADPKNLFDIGFQLSFTAVAGILLLYDLCRRSLPIVPAFIAASMSVSLSAWVGTAGITFYHFKTVTPVSILANIPIVPLADMVMVLGLGLAGTGGWCAPLAITFAACLKAILSIMVICAGWFSQIPGGHFQF